MKKLTKYIVIFIILISLMMQTTITIKAEGGPEGSGDSGCTSNGTIRLVEGANSAKSGWLISLAKEKGNPIDCVFVTTTKRPIFTTTNNMCYNINIKNGFATCTEETSSKDTEKGVLAVDLTTEI